MAKALDNNNFLTELKRRNVFRAAATHIVIGWLVVQVAGSLEAALNLPEWLDAVALVIFLIGFPVVVIFSWAFEITPHGIERTRDVPAEQSTTYVTGRRLDQITIACLVVVVAFVLLERNFSDPVQDTQGAISDVAQQDSRTDEEVVDAVAAHTSIAVLPFVNLSSDPEQDYFSDGISEELLNLLAKIPDLHVTSRSSAFAFKNKDINIPEVASKLGVAHVVEGSVRKSGVTVRITAQLIEADTDKHLWSETYDRKVDDIFAVQDEISAAIVAALAETLDFPLTSGNASATHTRPSAAYATYLLGMYQYNQSSTASFEEARRLFEQAIEEDPGFAPPYANLGIIWLLMSTGYGDGSISFQEGLKQGGELIDKALELDPTSADAFAAQGLRLSHQSRTLESISALTKALQLNPSHSSARNWLSMAYRSQRRSSDELATLLAGHARDPLKHSIATNLVKSLSRFRRHDEALPVLERLKTLSRADHGFSLSESKLLQGRYADGIVAGLRGEEQEPGQRLPLRMASYLLAAMGELTEAHRLDPWQGGYVYFTTMIDGESRDHRVRLKANQAIGPEDADAIDLSLLAWANLANGNREEARLNATKAYAMLSEGDRPAHAVNAVLAAIAWLDGKPENAMAQIEPLAKITRNNLSDGDQIAYNYLIMAVAEQVAGNREAVIDNLTLGLRNNAPMTFEGDDMWSTFAVMGWNDDPEIASLLAGYEARNQAELKKIFELACNGSFSVWEPLPASCKKYVPAKS